MKQDRIETHESPYTHGRQFRNVTTHPRPTHTEECSGGPNVEQIVGGTFWTREKCHGCEVQAVVSFYGVYDFTRWAGDAGNQPMLDRIFGKWDTETLRKYSPLFHVRRDMPPRLLIQGTKDELHAGTMAYAERLKQADARYELVLLEGAPHGMENWAGHTEWEFYKQRLVDWLNATLHR